MLKMCFSLLGTTFFLFASSSELSFTEPFETKVIKETVQGYEAKEYVFKATVKQKISIDFKSKHGANYFNFRPSGATSALFSSEVSTTSMSMHIPQSGYYTVQVYLMRSAARRNEKASFTLNITLENDQNAPEQTLYPKPPLYYDAYALIPCSFEKPTFDMLCEGIVIRDVKEQSARFWIRTPLETHYSERGAFLYQNKSFFHGQNANLSMERQEDNNSLNLDGKIYYRIPDAFVLGG